MRYTTVVLAFACLFLTTASSAQYGPGIRVGGWSLRMNGELRQGNQYFGPCPVDLKFGWGLIPAVPTRIAYQFARSDGGHTSHPLFADLTRAGGSNPVYDDWRLGANTPQFMNYSGWVNLIIEGSPPVEQKISFTIHCG